MRALLWFILCLAPASAEVQPLLEAANAAYLRGDYEAAREGYSKAWEEAQQLPANDPFRYEAVRRLAAVRAASGELDDAETSLQIAINWREDAYGQTDPRVAEDLLVSAAISRARKNYDRALLILNRALTIHRVSGSPPALVAEDYSRMAQIQMEKEDPEAASGSLKTALDLRTQAAGPLDVSLVRDLDRLGSLYLKQRDYPNAEKAFRHALVIRESIEGRNDADLIASIDGLAYACFGQKKYDQAEPLYQRLVALWTDSVGPEHPMVAMVLDKVAAFYADRKNFDRAKEAQEHANGIRAHFMATGLAAAAAEQLTEGNPPEAIALYQRALAVMNPPDAVTDELRGDIGRIVKMLVTPVKATPRKLGARKN